MTAEKDTEIAALKQENEVLKGEMPNPGGSNKKSGGLSEMNFDQLNDYALKNPDQKGVVLEEIKRRNAQPHVNQALGSLLVGPEYAEDQREGK